jgi:hypothetical protein
MGRDSCQSQAQVKLTLFVLISGYFGLRLSFKNNARKGLYCFWQESYDGYRPCEGVASKLGSNNPSWKKGTGVLWDRTPIEGPRHEGCRGPSFFVKGLTREPKASPHRYNPFSRRL